MCHSTHVVVKGQLVEVGSLLLPRWFPGIKLRSCRLVSKCFYGLRHLDHLFLGTSYVILLKLLSHHLKGLWSVVKQTGSWHRARLRSKACRATTALVLSLNHHPPLVFLRLPYGNLQSPGLLSSVSLTRSLWRLQFSASLLLQVS